MTKEGKGRSLWSGGTILPFDELRSILSRNEIDFCLDEDGPCGLLGQGLSESQEPSQSISYVLEILAATTARLRRARDESSDITLSDRELQDRFDFLFLRSRQKLLSHSESFSVAVCLQLNKGHPMEASVCLLFTKGRNVFEKVERLTRAMKKHGVKDEACFHLFPKRQ